MNRPGTFRLALSSSLLALSASFVCAADVAVTDEQIKRLEIKLEKAIPAKAEASAVLSGTVIRPINSRLTAITPYAGTVVQVHVLPGQRVTKGDPLATISSKDLLDAEAELAKSEADLQIADAIARRKRMLADKNYQSPDVALEAEAQVEKIKAVIERLKRSQSLHGIKVANGAQFILTAEADGVVAEASVMPGEKVEQMSGVVTLDTSDDLWVDVQVPVTVIPRIAIGDGVMLSTGVEGRIVSIGGSLDPQSRSAKLYAALPQGTGFLPGQMVTVALTRPAVSGALSVPSTAVTRIDDKPSVFVKTSDGFAVRPVELRGRSPDAATVLGNLTAGEAVAASGLPELEQLLSRE